MNPHQNGGNLSDDNYVSVTPAGCHYATESSTSTAARSLIYRILSGAVAPAMSDFKTTEHDAIFALQNSGLLELNTPCKALPEGNLIDLLPQLLPGLSEQKKVVLTESSQGLFVDYSGVSRCEAEELSVLAGCLQSISERRTNVLGGEIAINSRAFGIIDPAGNSEIGFWPLHIHDQLFTLIVLGIPRFNTAQFSTLVWALIERYGPSQQTLLHQ